MELLIQNQELVLITSTMIILIIAIFLIAMLAYKFRKYAEYTSETFEEHVKTFQEQWKDIEKLRKENGIFSVNIGAIKKTLSEPLYQVGNIVDFTDIDSGKTLSGKIIEVFAYSGNGELPQYSIETEPGIYYTIEQNEITAWTN